MMVADETEPRNSAQALSVLWQRKALIGGLVAGATGLAVLALQFIEPRFTAEALIALNTRSGAAEQLLTTKPMVNAPPLTTVLVSTEKNVLESRGLAIQVVDALALTEDPEFATDLKPSALPPVLAEAWRGLKDQFRDEADKGKDRRTLVIDEVQRRLTVKSDADSYVIRLQFDSEQPEKAALVANAFADLYIRGQREAKLAEMQVATDWLTQQITNLRSELVRDTASAVAFRQKNKLSPAFTRDKGMLATQQLVNLSEELAVAERQRAEAESALSQARRAKAQGGMVSLTFVDESPFLQEMRKEEAKILGKLAELSVGYREESPALAALKGQLGSLRGEIDREIGKQVDMLAHRAAQAKAREDVLKQRMSQISGEASSSDKAVTELQLREREIESKNLMLESFVTRYNELTNRAQIEEPDARIASRAQPPAKPSYPKPFLFMGVAFAGSLGLSLSLAFFLERFRTGFTSTRQVREALGLATLGIIPDTRRLGRMLPGDYPVEKPESVYAEAVRSAQLAILNARGDQARKGILITSSVPGEGKTAFAVSLGRCLALAEKKVLLVDCDLRRPSVARQLNSYEIPGLSDYLRQQASLEEIIRHDPRSGLDYVASGGRIQDPQRLLEDPATGRAFEHFLAGYDVVLVDTPPTMVAYDAAILAAISDFALYVVEWNQTPARAVEAGIEHLRSFDIPVGGVVLTKVDLERQRQYSDYVDFCFRSSEYYGN